MYLTVSKFGGSSINDTAKLNIACSTISSFVEKGERIVVVVSAVRGVTDALNEMIEKIEKDTFEDCFSRCEDKLKKLHSHSNLFADDFSDLKSDLYRFMKSSKKSWIEDQILVRGEELSARNFANKLNERGINTELVSFDDPWFPTVVYGNFGNARVDLDKTRTICKKLVPKFEKFSCLCIPGYGGVDRENGRVKTLRRGGSDTVAIALSYGFSANSLWIITDTCGIKRTYTKKITNAPTIPIISVEELRDAGVYGAKVPNETAIRPLMSYCPEETFVAKYDEIYGKKTRVVKEKKSDKEHPVELAAQRGIVIYEFNGVNMHSKISHLESELNEKLIDFISLGGGEYTRKLIIPADQESYVDEFLTTYKNGIEIIKSSASLVGIVGKGMESTAGVIAQMGRALAKKEINIYYQFDISPISCGVIVDRSQAEAAVDLLYEEFNLSSF